MMDDSRVRKASDLLGALLSPEAAAKADAWSGFFGFWAKAAGENLAAHSRPVDVRNGTVFIEADHPGWIQLLQMEQGRILDTIRRTFPALGISGIAFRIARDPSLPGNAGTARGTELETDPANAPAGDRGRAGGRAAPMPTVEQTIEAVSDDAFRGILSSLAGTLEAENRDKARLKAAGKAPKPR